MNQALVGHKGGKGGGGEARVPQEDPNTLRSAATARVVDVLGEGEIGGLVDGLKSVYYDDTPIQNQDGSFNYHGLQVGFLPGLPDQPALPGNAAIESEKDVSVQVMHDTPITRTITASDTNAVRVTVQVPRLTHRNKENGDLHGSSVNYVVEVRANGAASWTTVINDTISGKTTSPYQRATRARLPGAAPWQIRVRRVSADSTKSNTQNDLYWVSYTEIIDAKLIYPDTALVGVEIDARQFGSDIPSRKYDVHGLIISVPSNYDPPTRTYTGLWDGTFKRAWSDNPAWVFYDLLVNRRYGADIPSADKWALYEISKYCDEIINDGFGGQEPRYTFNTVIASQSDVYTALAQMASVFRGMLYWGTNTVMATADMPGTPIKLVTAANVINGEFEYSGQSRSQRHSVAMVSWNDPDSNDRLVVEVVENKALIEKFGWQPLQITAVACSSRGQAHRLGKWALDTEIHEGETVTYAASTDHADIRPGDLIKLSDPNRAGARMGGRIITPGTTTLTLDKVPDSLPTGVDWYLDVVLPSGAIERRQVSTFVGNDVTLTAALSDTPVTAAGWILSSTSVEPRQFRIISVHEQDNDGNLAYQITALAHDPTKYARVEQGIYLEPPDTTLIPTGPLPAPTNLTVDSYTYIAGGTQHQAFTVSVTPSDDPRVIGYIMEIKGPADTHWRTIYNGEAASRDVLDIEPGSWQVRVRAYDGIGHYSPWVFLTTTVNGLLMPGAPTGFNYHAGTFTITINPSGLTTGATWEYWMSQSPLTDAQIESNARLVGIGSSVTVADLHPATLYYFYVRGVNVYGKSDWTPVQITTENDSSAILANLAGQITESELAQYLADEINGNGIQIQTNTQDLTNLSAQYTVKIDNNGYVTGFGLASTNPIDGTPFSEFYIRTDRFAMIDPGAGPSATPTYPFIVDSGNVYIKEALIDTLTFDKLTNSGGNFIVASGKVQAQYIEANQLIIGYNQINGTPPDSISNALDENGVTTIANPGGARYKGVGNDAGAIVITLPQSWTHTMMQFDIAVFDYSQDKSFVLTVAGYTSGGGLLWANTSASLKGSIAADNRVRFGHDGTKCCIVIGNTGSVWDCPAVDVRNFQASQSNDAIANWDDGWSISTETSLAGYTFTQDYSDALIDAKRVVGQGALATQSDVNLNSQVVGTLDWGSRIAGAGKPDNNADVTANNTASGIAGQGAFATVNAINSSNLASLIANGTITGAVISNAAISNAKIANGAITNAKISNLAVTNAKIRNGAITSAKIGTAQITNVTIGNAAVDTLQVAGNAITLPVSWNGGTYWLPASATTSGQKVAVITTAQAANQGPNSPARAGALLKIDDNPVAGGSDSGPYSATATFTHIFTSNGSSTKIEAVPTPLGSIITVLLIVLKR